MPIDQAHAHKHGADVQVESSDRPDGAGRLELRLTTGLVLVLDVADAGTSQFRRDASASDCVIRPKLMCTPKVGYRRKLTACWLHSRAHESRYIEVNMVLSSRHECGSSDMHMRIEYLSAVIRDMRRVVFEIENVLLVDCTANQVPRHRRTCEQILLGAALS